MKTMVTVVTFLLTLCTCASAATLTWKDNSQIETGFSIEMLTTTSTWIEVARVGANVATYTDANAEGVYRVKAFITIDGKDHFSGPSNTGLLILGPASFNIQ